jgi:release factor glutamine methyltransferase
MLSTREIQEKTVGYFAGKGVPNPKLDTDMLIAHVLGVKRLELYLDIDRPLTEEQLNALRPLVKRRAGREPLQYILGQTEFCGMQLKVDARALIPRPETEELVEHIRERVVEPPQRILDLGTGSGAIAIALALMYPEAEVWATDQSAEALELAKENAAANVSGSRIHFCEGSWWEAVPGDLGFDLIVANPPYLTEAEMQTAEPEVVANEPKTALFSGRDGLNDLKAIIAGAKERLAPGGMLALETGIAQHDELESLCATAGLKGQGTDDISGRPRFYFIEAADLDNAGSLEPSHRYPHPSPGNYAGTRAQPLQENPASKQAGPPVEAPPLTGEATAKPVTDAGLPSLKPNADSQLRKGRISSLEARYFITCCTQDRKPGLETEGCAPAILSALNELHAETSIDLLAATVMPDHIHILMRLGRRLELSQVVGKLKVMTHGVLDENGLAWQDNYYDHRLRAEDAAEKFAKYIFLNPYRVGLVPLDEMWPWWMLNENYRPEFLALLDDPPLPPEEWLGDSPTLEEIVGDDR